MNVRRIVVGMGFAVAATALASESFALRVDAKGVHLDSLADYDKCQDRSYSGAPCHEALLEWVKTHPNDAFAAGKLTRARMNPYNAVPFFVQALEAKKGTCSDDDLRRATIAGLGLPPDYADAAGAKKIAFTLCKNELASPVRAELTSRGYYADNVCGAVKADLPKDKAEFCEPPKPEAPPAPETLSPGADKTVNPYGKFFRGQGLEIEVATFDEENAAGLHDVLIRMKGADAHTAKIDGKVIRLVAVGGGKGVDFKYTNDKGEVRVRMSMRKIWGDHESYEAYFGTKTVRLHEDDHRAKAVKPEDLLKVYAPAAAKK